MVMNKAKTIKTADFEAEVRKLEQDIKETEYITKTAILRLVEAFKERLISYEPIEDIKIPDFMEVR
jgi:predicted RND superfamily exporter protein